MKFVIKIYDNEVLIFVSGTMDREEMLNNFTILSKPSMFGIYGMSIVVEAV